MTAEIKWCKIIQSGIVSFEGRDTQSFLQGQLTNNVASLDAVHSQYTGYCTPKGRLLAVMLLWRRENSYYMMLPRELCEPVRKRLAMYILRAKVKAEDRSADFALFGLSGAGAAEWVTTLAGALPQKPHEVAHGAELSILKLPIDRFLVIAPVSKANEIEAALAKLTPGLPDDHWSSLDIEAGIPSVVTATQEQFVPQTVNFDLINAVSFDKGCYPGQEIVARTHFLGKLKQRMVRARLRSTQTPAAGDKLYSEVHGNQASGMLVSAFCTAADVHTVLAVIQTSDINNAPVRWKSPNGAALEIQPLPYRVK